MSIQVEARPMAGDDLAAIIEDAYQAECERFDAEMERADGDVVACCHDLQRAAGTPKMRALADRLVKAGEEAAGVRNRGFFVAGVRVGIRIAASATSAMPACPSPSLCGMMAIADAFGIDVAGKGEARKE